LRISGPQSVEGDENLTLTTIITNTGNEMLKLLNDPRSPLSTAATDTFDIKDSAGKKPSFIGIEADHDPFEMAVNGGQDNFLILGPGESVSVDHDLSKVYNFAQPSSGYYTFEARNIFYYMEPSSSAISALYANSPVHKALVPGHFLSVRQGPVSPPEKIFLGCTDAQHSTLTTAGAQAKTYIEDAVFYMRNNDPPKARYITWFGAVIADHVELVSIILTKLGNIDFPALSYDCTCTIANQYAWVTRSSGPLIHICPLFWGATNYEQAGILIMEASHWTDVADTHDFAWSATDCRSLAVTDPAQAIDNAASYAYFCVNIEDQPIP